jgi:hypothetical protein
MLFCIYDKIHRWIWSHCCNMAHYGLFLPWFNSSKSYRAGGHYIYWLTGFSNLCCLVYLSSKYIARNGPSLELIGLPVAAGLGLIQVIYLGFWSGRTAADVSQNVFALYVDFCGAGSIAVLQLIFFLDKRVDEEGKSSSAGT